MYTQMYIRTHRARLACRGAKDLKYLFARDSCVGNVRATGAKKTDVLISVTHTQCFTFWSNRMYRWPHSREHVRTGTYAGTFGA